jgi:hypothetical protein
MRKWLSFLIMGLLFAFPLHASAQNEIELSDVTVQLWPEYDQPSMLVIFDFTISDKTSLPAQVTFRLPTEANIIAVAYRGSDNNLLNAIFEEPTRGAEWQTLTIKVESFAKYRVEYYEPLTTTGSTRRFSYLWPGDYAVDVFNIGVQEPVDTNSVTGEPALEKTQANGVNYYIAKTQSLSAGQQYILNLQYDKKTDALAVPPSGVQTGPINDTTSGRVALNNYLPYILGGVGVLLIVGGLVYYFQSSRAKDRKSRRRSGSQREGDSNVHCHQCGTRAHSGDRFCRTCGTRLRIEE